MQIFLRCAMSPSVTLPGVHPKALPRPRAQRHVARSILRHVPICEISLSSRQRFMVASSLVVPAEFAIDATHVTVVSIPRHRARRLVIAFARSRGDGLLDDDVDTYGHLSGLLQGSQPSQPAHVQYAWVPFRGALYLPLWMRGGHNEWWRLRRVLSMPPQPPPPPAAPAVQQQAAAAGTSAAAGAQADTALVRSPVRKSFFIRGSDAPVRTPHPQAAPQLQPPPAEDPDSQVAYVAAAAGAAAATEPSDNWATAASSSAAADLPRRSFSMAGTATPQQEVPAAAPPVQVKGGPPVQDKGGLPWTTRAAANVTEATQSTDVSPQRPLFMLGTDISQRQPPSPPPPPPPSASSAPGKKAAAVPPPSADVPERSLFMLGTAIPERRLPRPATPMPDEDEDKAEVVEEGEAAQPSPSLLQPVFGGEAQPNGRAAAPSPLPVETMTPALPPPHPAQPKRWLFMHGTAIPYRASPPAPHPASPMSWSPSEDEDVSPPSQSSSDPATSAESSAEEPKRSLFMLGSTIPYRATQPALAPPADEDVRSPPQQPSAPTEASVSEPRRSLVMGGTAIPYRAPTAAPAEEGSPSPQPASPSGPDQAKRSLFTLGTAIPYREPQSQPPASSAVPPLAASTRIYSQSSDRRDRLPWSSPTPGDAEGTEERQPAGSTLWSEGRAGVQEAAGDTPPSEPLSRASLFVRGSERPYRVPGPQPSLAAAAAAAAERTAPSPSVMPPSTAPGAAADTASAAASAPTAADSEASPGRALVSESGPGRRPQFVTGPGIPPRSPPAGLLPQSPPAASSQPPGGQGQQPAQGCAVAPAVGGGPRLASDFATAWQAYQALLQQRQAQQLQQQQQNPSLQAERAVGLPPALSEPQTQQQQSPQSPSGPCKDALLRPAASSVDLRRSSTEDARNAAAAADGAQNTGGSIPWSQGWGKVGLPAGHSGPASTAATPAAAVAPTPTVGAGRVRSEAIPWSRSQSETATTPGTAAAASAARAAATAATAAAAAAAPLILKSERNAAQQSIWSLGTQASAAAAAPEPVLAVARSAAAPRGRVVLRSPRTYEWELAVSCYSGGARTSERLLSWTRVCALPGGDLAPEVAVLAAEARLRKRGPPPPSNTTSANTTRGDLTTSISDKQGDAEDGDLPSSSSGAQPRDEGSAPSSTQVEPTDAVGVARAATDVYVTPDDMAAALRRVSVTHVSARVPSDAQKGLLRKLVRRRRLDAVDPAVLLLICPDGWPGVSTSQDGDSSDGFPIVRDDEDATSASTSRGSSKTKSSGSTSFASASASSLSVSYDDVQAESSDVKNSYAGEAEAAGVTVDGGSSNRTAGAPAGRRPAAIAAPPAGLLLHHILALQALEEAEENTREAEAAAAAIAAGLPPPMTQRQQGFVRTLLRRAARGVEADAGSWLRKIFQGAVPERRLRRLVDKLVGDEYIAAGSSGISDEQRGREAAMYSYGRSGGTAVAMAEARAKQKDPLEELLGSLSREGAKDVINRLQRQVARLPRGDS